MTGYEEKLSAFLDGELPEDEAREIEAAVARDPALRAELETLMAANSLAVEEFAELAGDPVPPDLADAIRNAPETGPANLPAAPGGLKGWMAVAAAVVLLALGGLGGYTLGSARGVTVATAPGWLLAIAEYHGVYAKEKRHLVEVGAEEADHIVAWLTGSVGAEVRIPDLAQNGLTFEGARLLVAAGKPVAQLMYTDTEGAVVALCLIASASPNEHTATRSIGGFQMVSWGGRDANFVIVGDEGRGDLQTIAEAAAAQV